MKTIQEAARSALDVQSAPNVSGIVFSFAKAMEAVCDHERDLSKRREHPVVVLYAMQIAYLTGVAAIHSDPDAYGRAYRECERLAAS